MKVYFFTLGCRVNQYETDAARELFLSSGYELVGNPEEADICIVNTCTVTGEADRKSRQHLRKFARVNPDAIIVAMGCASEMADGEVDADIVCGTHDKNELVARVEAFLAARDGSDVPLTHKTNHVRPEVSKKDDYHDFGTVLSPEGTRAFVKIEDGCNQFCSYCIIPFARGRVASRSEANIIAEVWSLAEQGYCEVVLSGIHLCSYGKDRGEDIMALLEVIRKIDAIPGIERIRLGSVEPLSLTDEFIEGLGSVKKLCPHFHLSLQSGSDTVLKRMNRTYNSEQYASRVALLREKFPTMQLTTDVICGFPGETDEEFAETCEFVEKVELNKIHVFPYSVREGTKAAKMEQLPSNVSHERAAKLKAWSEKREEEYASSFIGKEVEVLLESEIEGEEGAYVPYFRGYTYEYVKTEVEGAPISEDYGPGDVVTAVVRSVRDNVLICEMIDIKL